MTTFEKTKGWGNVSLPIDFLNQIKENAAKENKRISEYIIEHLKM